MKNGTASEDEYISRTIILNQESDGEVSHSSLISFIQSMDNLDILREVTSSLDNTTLESISHTSLWNSVKLLSEDQLWWYHRTEYLVGRTLAFIPGNWKRAYASIKRDGVQFNLQRDYRSHIVVYIMLELGDPASHILEVMRRASSYLNIDVFRLLLADPRVDPSVGDNYAIRSACYDGSTEIVKLLLEDPRVDPSDNGNECIYQACYEGYPEIVKLLLNDRRVDPTFQSNLCLRQAVAEEHTEVVLLLLADKRVDPSSYDNDAIRTASGGGDTDIVRMLLEDPRVDPSAMENEAITLACRYGFTEVVRLLLEDSRVDPTADILHTGTPFSEAVVGNRIEVVRLLLERQEVRDLLNNQGEDIIQLTCKVSSLEMIQLLIEAGVNPTGRNNNPLRMARKLKRYDVEKLLLRYDEVRGLDEKMKRR